MERQKGVLDRVLRYSLASRRMRIEKAGVILEHGFDQLVMRGKDC